MNEKLSNKLLDDFPRLYRDWNKTSMQNYFSCGDGWFDLIYRLSQDIETVAREGGLNLALAQWPLCRQVKEKMGSLRFIVFAADEYLEIYERISALRLEALNQSLRICEYCGKPGELVTDDRIATMCSEHARQAATDPAFPSASECSKKLHYRSNS
jgi:hypothetical protein